MTSYLLRMHGNIAIIQIYPKGSIPNKAWEKFEFIRKGKVGDWVNFFKDQAKLKEFDQSLDC